MTDTQGTEPARGAQATRGAVTTADRARHILHTQLEADFCQAPGSISRALEELRDYPEAESLPLLATVQPPSEKMGAARRRNDDIWELRVANYASVGILCAKHPRVLDKVSTTCSETSRTGSATTRSCASSTNCSPLHPAGQRHEHLLHALPRPAELGRTRGRADAGGQVRRARCGHDAPR